MSSTDIKAGADWKSDLRKHLSNADMLLFMFTEPSATWDWCLYECGIFTPLRRPDNDHEERERRIVCLHYKDGKPPKPLSHLRSIEATPRNVEEFLEALFHQTEFTNSDEPLDDNYERRQADYERAAEEICSAMTRGVRGKPMVHFMALRVAPEAFAADGALSDKCGVPHDTIIESNSATMAMFGMTEVAPTNEHWSWAALLETIEADDQECFERIDETFVEICSGKLPRPIDVLYHSTATDRYYRPLFLRRDVAADGASIFNLLFVEQPEAERLSDLPGGRREQAIIRMLEVGRQLHSKLIVEFFEEFMRMGSNASEDIKRKLSTDVKEILDKARNAFFFDRQSVLAQFDPEQRERVGELYDRWEEIGRRFYESLEDWDLLRIRDNIEEFRRLNIETMGITVARYQQLLAGLVGLQPPSK